MSILIGFLFYDQGSVECLCSASNGRKSVISLDVLNSSIQYRQRLHFGLALIAELAVSTLSEVKIIQIFKIWSLEVMHNRRMIRSLLR